MPVKICCAACRRSFSVAPSKAITARYCSRNCQGNSQGKEALRKAHEASRNREGPLNNIAGLILANWHILRYSHSDKTPHARRSTKRYFWHVRCTNCGNESVKATPECKRPGCSNCVFMEKGATGLNLAYRSYQTNATNRNLSFDLSIESFKSITSSPCYYCGKPPVQLSSNKKSHGSRWGDYLYNGIDRVDNALGYYQGNCRPCCGICNVAKGSLSEREFLEHIMAFAGRVLAESVPCLMSSVKAEHAS